MSYHMKLGQSQVPADVMVSEVDLPATQHFNRWAISAFNPITPMLNVMDPLNLFHGGSSSSTPSAPPPAPSMVASLAPVVGTLALAGGVGWFLWKRKKQR